MRSQPLPQTESSRDVRLRLRSGGDVRRLAFSAARCAAVFLASGAPGAAQTASAQNGFGSNPAQNTSLSAPAPVHKSVHPRKKSAVVVAPAPQPDLPPAPVLPPPPDWPANDPPAAASVVYDSRGLLIIASNSSLAQILKDVSTDTGAKVGRDERRSAHHRRANLRHLWPGVGARCALSASRWLGGTTF